MFDDFQPELLYRNFVKYSSPEGRDELAQQCRAKVVEWRWASDDMAFAFQQPFVKERYRCDPKWLKEGAKLKSDSKRHGLDAEGLIHVVEDLTSNAGLDQAQISAKYLSYQDNQIESVRYLTPGSLQLVQRRLYKGPRILREHNFGSRHGSEQQYEWQGQRLHRILSMGWRHDVVHSETKRFTGLEQNSHSEQIFEYDELGRLVRIVERSLNRNGTIYKGLPPRINYERPKKNESIPQLAKEIERMLIEQIPLAVAKARGKGPFYCMLICYCGEDFDAGWPPMLMLKPEAERRRIVERGEEVKYFLWAPDESDETNVRLRYGDETLENSCRLHCQLMDVKENYSSAKKALRNAAKALNELDWPKLLDVTPDFIVAAVDNTGEFAFATDIKAVVPAAKFKALKANGMI